MPFDKTLSVYQYLMDIRKKHGAGFLVLIDPDRSAPLVVTEQAKQCRDAGVDAILIGASIMMDGGFEEAVESVKSAVDIPVIIFPGEKSQVTSKADAILFLSLLSGRNPEFIIGEQVRSAPLIKSFRLEAISTAYLLVESGKTTSVEFMSNTKPLPPDKPEIALAHAMAAEIFGMKLIYLEAGSGAVRPVPDEMIRVVSSGVNIPVMVGGGIRTPETVAAKVASGASFVVIGNHLEHSMEMGSLKALVNAAHRK
ncbi:MAG: geranylgeranylglyceryl/heptaprenylglyceryl phosphate synthase [Candidatus Latescibacter sp.]|nr:geranylgeranylglyceryl/heptaprenylglyceryl phosphate synthase [Candidatus Latescibacter sp.]